MAKAPVMEEWLGHPKGLFVLFFTEMWERFSYYGMRAILVLYMVSELSGNNPGLGWDQTYALSIYGWYTMACYLAAIPGGLLGDRLLGQKRSVMLGGLLLCLGHSVLAFNSQTAFFIGLVLIVLGVGSLKPNISTMVGRLYAAGDVRRDAGFTIFYIGINLGAFLASLIVGYVGERISWHYGFGLAGLGMLCGQLVYMGGQKHLRSIINFESIANSTSSAKIPLSQVEKDRLFPLGMAFLISIVFWGAFEQAGGLMNIYTLEKIDRVVFGWEIPASVFQSLNPLFIMIFGTVVASYWAMRKIKNRESSALFKMGMGNIIMGLGFFLMTVAAYEVEHSLNGKAALIWLVGAYFLHTIGELCASPVALSYITKVAPARYGSLMMGAYFAASGLGNKVAGVVGEWATERGELGVFAGIFIFCVSFGGLIIFLLRPLKRLDHGAEEDLVAKSA